MIGHLAASSQRSQTQRPTFGICTPWIEGERKGDLPDQGRIGCTVSFAVALVPGEIERFSHT